MKKRCASATQLGSTTVLLKDSEKENIMISSMKGGGYSKITIILIVSKLIIKEVG